MEIKLDQVIQNMKHRSHTDVDVSTVDGGGPPQGKPSVRDLVQTRPLSVS